MTGTEHRFTQRIRLLCPEGKHRLGEVNCAAVDAVMFENGSAPLKVFPRVDFATNLPMVAIDPRRGLVGARCSACVRSGLRKAAAPTLLRVADFQAIVAALHTYGPAATTVTFTKRGLREALGRVIPEGDPKSTQRLETLALLQAPHRPSDPPSGAVSLADIVGGPPEIRHAQDWQ